MKTHTYRIRASISVKYYNLIFLFEYFTIYDRYSDDIVILMVKKNKAKEEQNRAIDDFEDRRPTFCLEFTMSYTKRRRIAQLEWKKYSVNYMIFIPIF